MKKLEEMNLMDDFLVGSLLSHKKYVERAVRYILECILNRPLCKFVVVPQRNLEACFVIWKSPQRRMLHQIH